jgi:hypothetical protein
MEAVPEDRVLDQRRRSLRSASREVESEQLSANIRNFIQRTDHYSREWSGLQDKQRQRRATSVAVEDVSRDPAIAWRKQSFGSANNAFPRARSVARASSVARSFDLNNGYDEYDDYDGYAPPSRWRAGDYSTSVVMPRFTSLEDECNWIISGRATAIQRSSYDTNHNYNGYSGYQEDDDDDTLDDISGDEVSAAAFPQPEKASLSSKRPLLVQTYLARACGVLSAKGRPNALMCALSQLGDVTSDYASTNRHTALARRQPDVSRRSSVCRVRAVTVGVAISG